MNRSEKILNQRISVLESQLFNYYKMIKMYHTGDFSDKCDFNHNEMFVVDKVGNKNNIRLVDCSKLSIKTIHNVVKGLSKPTEKRIGI